MFLVPVRFFVLRASEVCFKMILERARRVRGRKGQMGEHKRDRVSCWCVPQPFAELSSLSCLFPRVCVLFGVRCRGLDEKLHAFSVYGLCVCRGPVSSQFAFGVGGQSPSLPPVVVCTCCTPCLRSSRSSLPEDDSPVLLLMTVPWLLLVVLVVCGFSPVSSVCCPQDY